MPRNYTVGQSGQDRTGQDSQQFRQTEAPAAIHTNVGITSVVVCLEEGPGLTAWLGGSARSGAAGSLSMCAQTTDRSTTLPASLVPLRICDPAEG